MIPSWLSGVHLLWFAVGVTVGADLAMLLVIWVQERHKEPHSWPHLMTRIPPSRFQRFMAWLSLLIWPTEWALAMLHRHPDKRRWLWMQERQRRRGSHAGCVDRHGH